MNETETPMGARLLKEHLGSPFRRASVIEERLDAIEECFDKVGETAEIRSLFHTVGDLERTVTRTVLANPSIHDFVRLRAAIADFPRMSELMSSFAGPFLVRSAATFDPLDDLHLFLCRALKESPGTKIKEGGFIAEGFDERLDELRSVSGNAKSLIAKLEETEQAKTGIASMKIKYNRVFGFFFEVSNNKKHLVPERYVCKQTLANAERYVTQELKELEEKILNAEEKSVETELELFEGIKGEVAKAVKRAQASAASIAVFDLILGLAKLAQEKGFRRPNFNGEESGSLRLVDSRHPVIESLDLEETFIPNDLALNRNDKFLMLITGPNMGGKSTFMRQAALIACMAQAGSFVPAETAELPLFDRIFTRVGASDNLAKGQSTFMVEMNEAALILNNATRKSLVILDEIGRGTGTYDGISIAWAIAEHLHEVGCFTLFATHYHELTDLEEAYEGVTNASVSVDEEEGNVIFLRKIVPGRTNRSYGIQVARLAGLPEKVIGKARSVLGSLERKEERGAVRPSRSDRETPDPFLSANENPLPVDETASGENGRFRPSATPAWEEGGQTLLFEESSPNAKMKEMIDACDVNRTTPLQALELLGELQRLARG